MSSNITIADVAQQAGVSVSTVSRILNNKPDVSKRTREHVLAVIDQLGYAPHAQAQGLAGGKGHMMAIHYPTEMIELSQLELDFFLGASTATDENEYFFSFITRLLHDDDLLRLYRSSQFSGVVLMQVQMQDDRVNLLRENNYPFVMIGRSAEDDNLSYIDLDFAHSVECEIDYLVELGHRQIGFINFAGEIFAGGYGPAVRARKGYERSLQRHQMNIAYSEAGISIEDMYRATETLLADNPNLTAIATCHGATTIGTIRALSDAGKTVPDDCSVVGIVSENVARLISPPLTAVLFPSYVMGYRAVNILIDMLNNPDQAATQILLEPELIVRDSTRALV
jgi:DNA-binding LacI/PurR family transcriptional regulator